MPVSGFAPPGTGPACGDRAERPPGTNHEGRAKRKWGLIALVALVAFGATGCGWLQLGGNAARTSFNKDETKLTADKLENLDFVWFDHQITHANALVVNGAPDSVFVAAIAANP